MLMKFRNVLCNARNVDAKVFYRKCAKYFRGYIYYRLGNRAIFFNGTERINPKEIRANEVCAPRKLVRYGAAGNKKKEDKEKERKSARPFDASSASRKSTKDAILLNYARTQFLLLKNGTPIDLIGRFHRSYRDSTKRLRVCNRDLTVRDLRQHGHSGT